jgi:hypothetical protein
MNKNLLILIVLTFAQNNFAAINRPAGMIDPQTQSRCKQLVPGKAVKPIGFDAALVVKKVVGAFGGNSNRENGGQASYNISIRSDVAAGGVGFIIGLAVAYGIYWWYNESDESPEQTGVNPSVVPNTKASTKSATKDPNNIFPPVRRRSVTK